MRACDARCSAAWSSDDEGERKPVGCEGERAVRPARKGVGVGLPALRGDAGREGGGGEEEEGEERGIEGKQRSEK